MTSSNPTAISPEARAKALCEQLSGITLGLPNNAVSLVAQVIQEAENDKLGEAARGLADAVGDYDVRNPEMVRLVAVAMGQICDRIVRETWSRGDRRSGARVTCAVTGRDLGSSD